MAKINKNQEEKNTKPEITRDDIRRLQESLKAYKQKRIEGILFSRFDQYMQDTGVIKISDGNIIVKDIYAYKSHSEVEERRKAWEAWQNEREGTMPVFDLKAIRPEGLVKTVDA